MSFWQAIQYANKLSHPIRITCCNRIQNQASVVQSRSFSKYLSKSATKRLPLTTKRAGKGYYKGNGCRSEGRHTSKGKFIMDRSKMLELVVPDLSGFKLKPYIAASVPKIPIEKRDTSGGVMARK